MLASQGFLTNRSVSTITLSETGPHVQLAYRFGLYESKGIVLIPETPAVLRKLIGQGQGRCSLETLRATLRWNPKTKSPRTSLALKKMATTRLKRAVEVSPPEGLFSSFGTSSTELLRHPVALWMVSGWTGTSVGRVPDFEEQSLTVGGGSRVVRDETKTPSTSSPPPVPAVQGNVVEEEAVPKSAGNEKNSQTDSRNASAEETDLESIVKDFMANFRSTQMSSKNGQSKTHKQLRETRT
jgi:hypothetical protein